MKKESPGEPGLEPRGVVEYIGGSEQCTGSEYTPNPVKLKRMVVGKTAAPYQSWVTVGRDLTQAQSESLKRGLHWSAKPVKVADNLSGVADHTQSHDRRLAPKSIVFCGIGEFLRICEGSCPMPFSQTSPKSIKRVNKLTRGSRCTHC